ncbi:MAG: bifunctional lysylphosphatidylglycerol synthetase/lysine--tRNA ligase LysX [Micrococcales bacterium]|nr:bifunctional lysylphosphatidylglycerol synthetase/lysine--tRNA ligase LysX [Micrococcales bacterium]
MPVTASTPPTSPHPTGSGQADSAMAGRASRSNSAPGPRQEFCARTITWLYALGGLSSVFLWLLDHGTRREHGSFVELLFSFLNVPVSDSLVSIVLLVLSARMLVGRKRVGLAVVAGFQVVGIAVGAMTLLRVTTYTGPEILDPWSDRFLLGPGLDIAGIASGVFVLGLCWWCRPAFPGRLRPGSWGILVTTVLGGLLLTTVVAWVCLLICDPAGPLERVLRATLLRALGAGGALDRRYLLDVPGWVPQLVSATFAATLVLAVFLFTRSTRNPNQWSPDRELAIRRLLAVWGDEDSLGYFATRRDKSYAFSPDGAAAVCYDVVAGVSLASGDPIGQRSAWPRAVAQWKAEARYFGWIPAVLGTSESGARGYIDAGFDALALGDEAILQTAHFRINNTSMTDVRRAAQRARRAGLTVRLRRQEELDPAEVTALNQLADRWRVGEVERGFSMAMDRHGDPADGRILYVTAHRDTPALPQSCALETTDAPASLDVSDVVGLLTFVPWGAHGLSLDLMRRDPSAPNGTTELLVTDLMRQCEDLGIRVVSLNFAFLRGVFADAERLGAGVLTKINSSLLGIFDRVFQLERLYRANQKYAPTWQPRYLCVDSRVSIPQVAVACGQAEGFLPRPLHRRRTPGLDAAHLGQIRRLETVETLDVEKLGPRRSDQTLVRLTHLRRLVEIDGTGYPLGVGPAIGVAQLAESLRGAGASLEGEPSDRTDPSDAAQTGASMRVAGRVRSVRDFGGVVFVRLVDGDHGAQLVLERDVIGARRLLEFTQVVDGGDILLVTAAPGTSRNGTPSLLVSQWQVLAKALHPVPFDSFNDPDARLRRRSTDLIVHPEDAALLRVRSKVITSVRTTLDGSGYLEVETPILHPVHGGASARPFTTFINAYGVDLYLRIAPELYLKRLVVAGLGPLYEIGRNFRNEGADTTHNPEFTSLEAYEPFGDYTTMRVLTQRIVQEAAMSVYGAQVLPLADADAAEPGAAGATQAPGAPRFVDVSGDWPVVKVLDAVSAAVGTRVTLADDFEGLLALARAHEVPVRPGMGPGAIVEALYGQLVEPSTVFPTFYIDFPVETSPLASGHPDDPTLALRWDLVAGGMEIGTAYSELADPLVQRRRLTEQSLKAAAGDAEAMQVDEDFLQALEEGMPPTGGLGIGVDRLVMLLTGTTIRAVLSFPFVRPDRGRR